MPGSPHHRTAPVLTKLCRLQLHSSQTKYSLINISPSSLPFALPRELYCMYLTTQFDNCIWLTSFSIFWNCSPLMNNNGNVSTSRWAEHSSELTLGYVRIQSCVTRIFHRGYGSFRPSLQVTSTSEATPHPTHFRASRKQGQVWATRCGCGLHRVHRSTTM